MERRLTAILAADVVGYSRLMGAHEAATLAALKTLRTDFIDPKVAEHQGRIVKLTGDGMLAEFPSVVSAVACAADVQRGMRARNAGVTQEHRIEFRIGVNLGDVIVETSSATASMWRLAWRASPRSAVSQSRSLCVITSAIDLVSLSKIWESGD